MVRNDQNLGPKTQKNLYKTRKNLSSEPARGARRRPGCRFELRRAKRAGAQTGIQVLGNEKVLAPESELRRFKNIPAEKPTNSYTPEY